MKTSHALARLAASAGLLALAGAAHATEQAAITNAHPASAASAPTAVRTLKFTTHHAVPATLTSDRDAPIGDGFEARFRFKGQTDFHTCRLHLPKAGDTVQRGDIATGTIVCTTPWQLYDNGLAFDAFEGGRKVAEGTLRP